MARSRAPFLCLVLAITLLPAIARAEDPPAPEDQEARAAARHEGTWWMGFMTDWAFHPNLAIWFDMHFNQRAFAVVRPGLTFRFKAGPSITAGYAHLWTDPGSGDLTRNEERVWGQLVFPNRIGKRWSLSHRIRYDIRFRENVEDGQVVPGRSVVHRLRYQSALSHWLPTIEKYKEVEPFLQLATEVLINFGEQAPPNRLDQFRVSVLAGARIKDVTVRIGYMDRFIPSSTGLAPVHEHSLILWWNHRFKFGKEAAKIRSENLREEAQN